MHPLAHLLRPLDLKAVKAGDQVVDTTDMEDVSISAHVNERGEIAVDWPSTGFVVYDNDTHYQLRMAPVAWIEDRPVYKGDTLYYKRDVPMIAGEARTVEGPHLEGGLMTWQAPIAFVEGRPLYAGDTVYSRDWTPDYLSWEKPKPMRKAETPKAEKPRPKPLMLKKSGWMNIYRSDLCAYQTREEADENAYLEGRLHCVEIHWEEPADESWVRWYGDAECPVADDARIEVVFRGDNEVGACEWPAGSYRWDHINTGSDIIAYRVVG